MLKAAKQRLLKSVFRRYFLIRLEELTGNRVLRLDYPAGSKPKYTPTSGAHPALLPWFQAHTPACQAMMRVIHEYRADLERIPPQPLFEKARSLIVGPHAKVVGYTETLFRGTPTVLDSGTKVPDAASAGYPQRFLSLTLECKA